MEHQFLQSMVLQRNPSNSSTTSAKIQVPAKDGKAPLEFNRSMRFFTHNLRANTFPLHPQANVIIIIEFQTKSGQKLKKEYKILLEDWLELLDNSKATELRTSISKSASIELSLAKKLQIVSSQKAGPDGLQGALPVVTIKDVHYALTKDFKRDIPLEQVDAFMKLYFGGALILNEARDFLNTLILAHVFCVKKMLFDEYFEAYLVLQKDIDRSREILYETYQFFFNINCTKEKLPPADPNANKHTDGPAKKVPEAKIIESPFFQEYNNKLMSEYCSKSVWSQPSTQGQTFGSSDYFGMSKMSEDCYTHFVDSLIRVMKKKRVKESELGGILKIIERFTQQQVIAEEDRKKWYSTFWSRINEVHRISLPCDDKDVDPEAYPSVIHHKLIQVVTKLETSSGNLDKLKGLCYETEYC